MKFLWKHPPLLILNKRGRGVYILMTKHTEKTYENRLNWERLMKKLKKEKNEPIEKKLASLEKKTEKPSYIR